MKATELLKTQHRKVEALFKRIEAGRSDSEALVKELAARLGAHMVIEETIFYPAIKGIKEGLVLESYEEPDVPPFAIRNLLATRQSAESFAARVTTLKELIDHYVEEEEEKLFPKVEKRLAAENLEELGAKMKAAFEALVPKGFVGLYGKSNENGKASGRSNPPAKAASAAKPNSAKAAPKRGAKKGTRTTSAHA